MRRCDKCSRELSPGETPDCADPSCPIRAESTLGPKDRTLHDGDALDRAAVLRYAADLASQDEDSTRLDEGPLDVTKLYDDDEEQPAFLEEIIRKHKAKLGLSDAQSDGAEPDDDEDSDATQANRFSELTIGAGGPAEGTDPDVPSYQDDLDQDDPTLMAGDVVDLFSLEELAGEGSDPTVQLNVSDVRGIAPSDGVDAIDGTIDEPVKRPRLTLSELRASLRSAVSAASARAASTLDDPITETEESEERDESDESELLPELLAEPESEDDYDDEDMEPDNTTKMSAADIELVAAGLDEETGPGTPIAEGTLELGHDDIFDAMNVLSEDEYDPILDIATMELAKVLPGALTLGDDTHEEARLDQEQIRAALALADRGPQQAPDPYGSGMNVDPHGSGMNAAPGHGYPQPGTYPPPQPPQPAYPPNEQHQYPPQHPPYPQQQYSQSGVYPPDPYGQHLPQNDPYAQPPVPLGPGAGPPAPKKTVVKLEQLVMIAIVVVALVGVALVIIAFY